MSSIKRPLTACHHAEPEMRSLEISQPRKISMPATSSEPGTAALKSLAIFFRSSGVSAVARCVALFL